MDQQERADELSNERVIIVFKSRYEDDVNVRFQIIKRCSIAQRYRIVRRA
ncbi:MAG: hypothetical protein J07HQW1_00656 [Haloquadratum walsbyi J07HQW1]|uniref:Uncharacterized protein n=1 Tax=Haloquadratum walsbyi J07HQW1 TaxID=1238424 RepID=U1PAP5_9EURY|nr:MAG: hypothetical protein J07HQW1_00656 [Haloquadratum walsbyi J07HQW1]